MKQRGEIELALIFIILAGLVLAGGVYYFYYRTTTHTPVETKRYDNKTRVLTSQSLLEGDYWYAPDIVIPPDHQIDITCSKPCEFVLDGTYTRTPPFKSGKFSEVFFTSKTDLHEELKLLKIDNYVPIKVRTLPITSERFNDVSIIVQPLDNEQKKKIQKILYGDNFISSMWIVGIAIVLILVCVGFLVALKSQSQSDTEPEKTILGLDI